MERITLDSDGYEELLEKAVSRIPALCPNWTNTRQSDPGITLIQLMAALTDIQNYTVNSVSELHKEAYIKLLGGRKQGVKCARASVLLGLDAGLIKDERIRISRKVFEYSGGDMFIQKETLVKSVSFYCDGKKDLFVFSFWAALAGTARVFKHIGGKIWEPAEFNQEKSRSSLSIKIKHPQKGAYRAVFYDYEYCKENGIACNKNGILAFGRTSGVTMQSVKVFEPEHNSIMSQAFKLWVNYGSHYEETGFNPIKDGFITLGNGRDFPVLKDGGEIEAFSLVLTKGATSLWARQPVFYKGKKAEAAVITVLSEGKNAETADEALLRINDMLAPKTCVTAADYSELIKKLYGSEVRKLKVISCGQFNKIIIYALLNNREKPFSVWRSELLKRLESYKLLTTSFEIHEAVPVPVTVEGEIALNAGDSVEIRENIELAAHELCECEIGSPVNSHTLTEKLSVIPHVKRINRLHVKYSGEIEDARKTLTCLDNFSVNFIFS